MTAQYLCKILKMSGYQNATQTDGSTVYYICYKVKFNFIYTIVNIYYVIIFYTLLIAHIRLFDFFL